MTDTPLLKKDNNPRTEKAEHKPAIRRRKQMEKLAIKKGKRGFLK